MCHLAAQPTLTAASFHPRCYTPHPSTRPGRRSITPAHCAVNRCTSLCQHSQPPHLPHCICQPEDVLIVGARRPHCSGRLQDSTTSTERNNPLRHCHMPTLAQSNPAARRLLTAGTASGATVEAASKAVLLLPLLPGSVLMLGPTAVPGPLLVQCAPRLCPLLSPTCFAMSCRGAGPSQLTFCGPSVARYTSAPFTTAVPALSWMSTYTRLSYCFSRHSRYCRVCCCCSELPANRYATPHCMCAHTRGGCRHRGSRETITQHTRRGCQFDKQEGHNRHGLFFLAYSAATAPAATGTGTAAAAGVKLGGAVDSAGPSP